MTLSLSTGAPELGATPGAFQLFTNTAASFNPKLNQVSLLDPTALQRLAIVSTGPGQNGTGTASFTPSGSTTAITVSIPGALSVDSPNNLALALHSATNNISPFHPPNTVKPNQI